MQGLVLTLVCAVQCQVGSVFLSCAFLYDIFWVFVSKKWFHESVMIVVCTNNISEL
jgi:signal peptide peptidase-like 2B